MTVPAGCCTGLTTTSNARRRLRTGRPSCTAFGSRFPFLHLVISSVHDDYDPLQHVARPSNVLIVRRPDPPSHRPSSTTQGLEPPITMADANSGYQNGFVHGSEGSGASNIMSRPFTLQEALPFSPQTSISPFVAGTSADLRHPALRRPSQGTDGSLTRVDLIPDPYIGSGTVGAGLTSLFSRDEFDAVNRAAEAQPSNRKPVKLVADALAHEIRPKERTDL